MVDQVRERNAADGNQEILHVGEIRLSSLPWPMSLLKDDILFRPMQRFPLRDMTLQRAYLDRLVALRMPLAQQGKQGGPLQGRVSFQLRHDPRPIFFKRIGTRSPRVGTFQFAWQLSRPFIPSSRSLAHSRFRRGDLLWVSFVSRLHK